MLMTPLCATGFPARWQETRGEVLAAIEAVGASGRYILGEEVGTFECDLARWTHRGYCIGCGNGMDAIEIGLRALGLRRGERVLTSPLSAFATTLAIVRAGGEPCFVDVDSRGLLDLSLVEEQLQRDPTLRFLVPVHLFGHALDMDHLASLMTEYGLLVVEDLAQALGARDGTVAAGSVGQIAATSFYPTKNLGALGDGGAILTDDDALARRCRSLRDYGQVSKYAHAELGLNSRLDEIQASVLRRVFLPRLADWTTRRRTLANRLSAAIVDQNAVAAVLPREGSTSVWHLFPTRVAADRRADLAQHLAAAGIPTAVHYPTLIADQPALHGVSARTLTALVNARSFVASELTMPLHPYLDESDIDRIGRTIVQWASQ